LATADGSVAPVPDRASDLPIAATTITVRTAIVEQESTAELGAQIAGTEDTGAITSYIGGSSFFGPTSTASNSVTSVKESSTSDSTSTTRAQLWMKTQADLSYQAKREKVVATLSRAALYQVRIIPKGTYYFLEVVYERPETQAAVSSSLFASLDLGVTNLAAITSNNPGFVPLLVNGRVLKSINQGYNKGREHLQKQLAKQDRLTSRRMKAITDKRNRRIQYQLHKASRVIIDLLVDTGIGTLIIGKNAFWK
jgi:transposase